MKLKPGKKSPNMALKTPEDKLFRVINPSTGHPIPSDGSFEVFLDKLPGEQRTYWIRALASGDVVEVPEEKPAQQVSETKSGGGK
jgi:hypothetical protein